MGSSSVWSTLGQGVQGIEKELRVLLADLQNLDLWPPWDAVEQVASLLSQIYDIATEPPAPDPNNVLTCGDGWANAVQSIASAQVDVDSAVGRLTTQAWDDTAGDAARISINKFSSDLGSLQATADAVNQALLTLADSMTTARNLHQSAYVEIASGLQMGVYWNPLNYLHALQRDVARICRGIADLVDAYAAAGTALSIAQRSIEEALDAQPFPIVVGEGDGAIGTVNGSTVAGKGPLRGTVLPRANANLTAMSPADRAAMDALLASAGDDQQRAWILAGIATGASPAVLARYGARIKTMSDAQLAQLDPSAGGPDFVQPDETTCGSTSLVMAKMINNPVYALSVMDGYDAATDRSTSGTAAQRFASAALAMHNATNGWNDHNGNLQGPWPKAAGTSPGALGNEMNGPGGAGVPGTSYQTQITNPADAGSQFDQLYSDAGNGESVPIYVGDGWAPRHVVLVTGVSGSDITVYDPSSGQVITVTREQYGSSTFSLGGWHQAWLASMPQ